MPSSQGSVKDHQPIDSATGITNSEFGTKALSVNMKNTATYLRSQITRSFTAAAKKLELAKIYMDDPDINRSERELRSIDLLRKEIMILLSIIETDSHFFDVIQTREVILSDRERTALKEVVIAHFAGKPRTEAIQDLKTAQQALHDILVARNFQFEPILSDAELAELSRELESFLDGENDEDKQDDGPIQNNDEEPGTRHFQSQQADTPISPIAAPPAVSTASITMSVPINGGLSGIPPQPVATPRTTKPLYRNLVNMASRSDPPVQHGINSIPLIQGADIEKCPCCSQAHKLYDCESRSIQKYCAVNGLCIYCTSDQHRSIECDLASRRSTPAPSTVGKQSNAGTRFVPPRNASTPHGNDHIPFEQPEYSWRGASRRERLNKSMMNDPYSAPEPPRKEFSHHEESDGSSENEWTEAKDIVEKRDNSISLPFKDVDAIIKPFEDEPKDYHRFTNMIQNMVLSNSRLNDTMKFALLEKKLVGKAKRYLIELNDPRAALMETMNSIHRAFSQDNSAVNSILRKFQELTFNSVDYTQTTEELDHCKALILQMQEYGVDVDSDVCVRSLISRIPRKIMQEMRIFFRKGKKPTLRQVLDCFTDVLEDLTFPDRFTTDSASTTGRTKELANTVMAMDAVRPQNPQTPKQPAKEQSQKNKNATKPSSSGESKNSSNTPKTSKPKNENEKATAGKNKNTQSKSNGNGNQKSETDQQQINVSDAANVYRPVNVGYTGYHPPHPQYNNPSYFPVYPTNGSPAPQNWSYGQNSNGGQGSGNNQSAKKSNPGNSARQNSKNTRVAKGPAPLPLGLIIGEQIESCYNSGIGWDKNFIAHTFCRSDQTPNRCCFMCGTGHSILQCPLPSGQVRQYLRDMNACHNCTKQGHATEDCQSKATCAYCQGKHNTGGCIFKEYYRDINNYPADAPRPVLGTFFRGPMGANE